MDESETLAINVQQTSHRLGLSPGTTRQAIKEGLIPSIRVGRRILVPLAALQRLLDATSPR